MTLAMAGSVSAFEDPKTWAQLLYNEHRVGRPQPVITAIDPELDMAEAYRIQAHFVALASSGEAPAGFKAGLTSPVARYRFRVNRPLAGVLFAAGRRKASAEVVRAEYPGLRIECELGFTLAQAVDLPLADTTELAALLGSVAPVVELPIVNFDAGAPPRAVDLAAGNVGSALYIVGRTFSIGDPGHLDEEFVQLYHDGKVIDRGKATNVMGGQLDALLWLVNHTVARGITIQPGQLLLTGAMGGMVPAEPGRYRAEFRSGGIIPFTVR
ncbi:MAG: hypothetical protein HKO62_11065 [Gammaproteobacteria bacterium]|nr:hypothetical protein [Gammaproteobacteria bacterium]NNM01281.1 hypothetical protein [Gammaproteobacteria bacterium]